MELVEITTEGLLTLEGDYAVQPRPFHYKLTYLKEGDAWKLARLDLKPK